MRWMISSWVVSVTTRTPATRPALMTTMRSATAMTWSMLWLTTITGLVLPAQRSDEIQDVGLLLGAKCGSRLVQEHDVAALMDRTGNGDSLSLPADIPPTLERTDWIRIPRLLTTSRARERISFLRRKPISSVPVRGRRWLRHHGYRPMPGPGRPLKFLGPQRPAGERSEMGSPRRVMVPSSGWWAPASVFMSVLFPAPLSPIKPMTSPTEAEKSTLLSACTPPKRFDMPRASSKVVICPRECRWARSAGRNGPSGSRSDQEVIPV